ncbi:nuclear transport factor 2 family protein [Epilithonimonas tenax]|uniref:nuclear transport factor 2 family protein n=1 Tax=Epilithonimonas tenax TaxID=191577 RepID=UPI00048378DE|nr:nuclear transport factor 2 family protein [Epilithonimonas tenax]
MIKKLLIAVSFLTVSMMFAQKNNDQQAVTNASEKLRLAMISGDKIVLESLILPELTYGHSSGHIDDAKEFVEKLVSKKSNFLTIENTNQSIQIVDKTAIVRNHLYGKTADLGKEPGEVNLDILYVWSRTKNGWKLLARQAVKAEKK